MDQQTLGNYRVHSELRGHHWVAWLTEGNDTRAVQSVLMVGQTREEAESRLRAWQATLAQYVKAPR